MEKKEDWRGLLAAGWLFIGSLLGADVVLFFQLEPSAREEFLQLYLVLATVICLAAKGVADHGKHFR